jgi:hypothetical protein
MSFSFATRISRNTRRFALNVIVLPLKLEHFRNVFFGGGHLGHTSTTLGCLTAKLTARCRHQLHDCEILWTGSENSDTKRPMRRKIILSVIWILWSYSFSSASSFWRYENLFETREDCLKAMEPYMLAALNSNRADGQGVIYYCFPDTSGLTL